MKKKKYPEDLMEEDLMETIQHRINELTAELKLLNARPGPLFMTRELLRRDLEREQERLRREQERRGREEQARREREAREDFLERSKWLVGKWNTPDGVLSFIDTDLDSGFYGQNGKYPFLCFTKSSEEDDNRLQFEWDGKPIYATVDGETLLWDDGDTYTRHDEQKEEQRIQREQVKEKLAGQWETFEALALWGHENGNALFQDLDVYMPGSDTPFLWFVGIDLNGCLIYEYDDDQRILAWFDGDRDDVLKWSDGSTAFICMVALILRRSGNPSYRDTMKL